MVAILTGIIIITASVTTYGLLFRPLRTASVHSSSAAAPKNAIPGSSVASSSQRTARYSPPVDDAVRLRVLEALPKFVNDYYHAVSVSDKPADDENGLINVYVLAQDAMTAEQFRILTHFGSNLLRMIIAKQWT